MKNASLLISILGMVLGALAAKAGPAIESFVPTQMAIVVHVQPDGESVWVGCSVKKNERIIDLNAVRVNGSEVQQLMFNADGASEARVSLWRGKEKCGLFDKCPQCRESNRNYHMVDRLADTGWQPVGSGGVGGF